MGLSMKKKPVSRMPVALDIDGRYLAAAGVEAGRLSKSASVDLEFGLVSDGEVRDAEALGATSAAAGSGSLLVDTEIAIDDGAGQAYPNAANPWAYTNPFNPCKPFNSERCHTHPPLGYYTSDEVPPIGPNPPADYTTVHPATPDG